MVEELDAGPIYSKINISLKGSLRQIFQRINSAINKLILEIVFKNLEPKEQKETLMCLNVYLKRIMKF